MKSWVSTYDCLFKVPIIDAPRFDGMRDTSQTFQHDIDRLIDELTQEFGVTCCHTLDSHARDGWIDAVLSASGLPLHPPQIDLFPVPVSVTS